jgi:hypothetical protein
VFDIRAERLKYCDSDVTIMRRANMMNRDLLLETTGVDPLVEATTVASTCNRIFRRNYLKKDTIGLVPPGGYRRAQRQSVVAIK